MTDLRYPIGPFEHTGRVTDSQLHGWIEESWHGRHHLAHITMTVTREGW